MSTTYSRDVFIVDGSRTPFLKVRGRPGPFSAADLAVQAGRPLLARQPFKPSDFDEVVVGSVMPSENECNIARVIALRLGCGNAMPAYTVQRNCASGMQAIDSAAQDIAAGRCDLVLAGGAEAMSQAPLKLNDYMVNWLADWAAAKSLGKKANLLLKLRPHFFAPIITILRGLSDPLVNLSMGQTAENIAHRFNISRLQMDEFSLLSHQRAVNAQKNQWLDEIVTIYDSKGKFYAQDDGVRPDSSLEKLAKLSPFFDRTFGQVTAGNSSQVTDGAALVILASETAVQKHSLSVLGKIKDVAWAALEPEEMGLGPVFSTAKLLQQQHLQLADIDYWEINEAFATVVLACVAAWNDDDYCKKRLGLPAALGQVDMARINVDGGAVALGHPVGATGARLVLHLLNVLHREQARLGVATICIGGGQGGAMLLERV